MDVMRERRRKQQDEMSRGTEEVTGHMATDE